MAQCLRALVSLSQGFPIPGLFVNASEPPNRIRRLNLERPLRAYDQVPEGTCQFEAGISNPWLSFPSLGHVVKSGGGWQW